MSRHQYNNNSLDDEMLLNANDNNNNDDDSYDAERGHIPNSDVPEIMGKQGQAIFMFFLFLIGSIITWLMIVNFAKETDPNYPDWSDTKMFFVVFSFFMGLFVFVVGGGTLMDRMCPHLIPKRHLGPSQMAVWVHVSRTGEIYRLEGKYDEATNKIRTKHSTHSQEITTAAQNFLSKP
eukprot:Pgem_evm1s7693